jgi:hypothetical protein
MNKYALNAMPLYGLIQLAENIAIEPEKSLKAAVIAAILEKKTW